MYHVCMIYVEENTEIWSNHKKVYVMSYREVHLLADLGWVNFDFGSSTFCLVLLGLMGSWQNWLCGWARWWSIPNLSQLHPVRQENGPLCTIDTKG